MLCADKDRISIHASLAGGDTFCSWGNNSPANFNPRLPRGRRPHRQRPGHNLRGFQSTPPSREATAIFSSVLYFKLSFQSTPPSREATSSVSICSRISAISIHASLAGGDRRGEICGLRWEISIHASLAGGDMTQCVTYARVTIFQSPPPSREATLGRDRHRPGAHAISIHASLAGGDFERPERRFERHISIHASLAGGDFPM